MKGWLVAAWLVSGLLFPHPARATEPKAPPPKPAAAAGSPRLNAYFAKGFEDAGWQRAAFDRVARSWQASSPPAPGRKAVVISTVTRDGKLLEARIDTRSGSDGWDRAALEAVRKAAPFPALPDSWPDSSLEAHWHFELAK